MKNISAKEITGHLYEQKIKETIEIKMIKNEIRRKEKVTPADAKVALFEKEVTMYDTSERKDLYNRLKEQYPQYKIEFYTPNHYRTHYAPGFCDAWCDLCFANSDL